MDSGGGLVKIMMGGIGGKGIVIVLTMGFRQEIDKNGCPTITS